MKARTHTYMFTFGAAVSLAERRARRTGERQRVELDRSHPALLRRWRVRPVEAPTPDASYDPTTFANGVTP